MRLIWSSETNLWEAFGSGDIWIAYAWPNDWVQMKKKGLKVAYMRPKEKPIAWVGMFMLLKTSQRPKLAHAYVDAWSSTKSAKWLEDNYGYGHANTIARPASSDLLKALQLTNPRAVTEPAAHLDRDIPRRATYANAVGAGEGTADATARPDDAGPARASRGMARRLLRRADRDRRALQLQRLSLFPGPHGFTLDAWRRSRTAASTAICSGRASRCRWSSRSSIVLLAYPLAYYLALSGTRRKYVLLLLLIAPFLTSYLLRVLAWKVILGDQGVINSFLFWVQLRSPEHPISQLLYSRFAVMLVLAYIWLPFVALPIFVSLENLDQRLLEAAGDLYASRWRAFFAVTLPLSLPGVIAAFFFVFIPTIGEFVTPSLVGGTGGLHVRQPDRRPVRRRLPRLGDGLGARAVPDHRGRGPDRRVLALPATAAVAAE